MGTFGDENIEAGTDQSNQFMALCCKFTSNGTGTATNISWYGRLTNAGNVKAAIFSDDGSDPDVKLGESGNVAVGIISQWWDFAINVPVVNLTNYYLAVISDTSKIEINHALGGAAQTRYELQANYTFPDPWGVSGDLAWIFSIHCDYTPSGVSKKRMLMGVGLMAKTPKFQPRKVVPWKCPLPLLY